MTDAPWMDIALKYKGQKEIKGSRHNPVVVAFFAKSGHPEIKDDETAWCMAFVNAVLYESDITGTNSLLAKSMLKWAGGEKVTGSPQYGDIVVFHRGSPSSWQGHVGFFTKWDDQYVYVLGGNQGDEVNITRYPRDRLAGIIRPRPNGPKVPTVPKMTDVPESKLPKLEEIAVGVGGITVAVKPFTTGDFVTGLGVIVGAFLVAGYMIFKRVRS